MAVTVTKPNGKTHTICAAPSAADSIGGDNDTGSDSDLVSAESSAASDLFEALGKNAAVPVEDVALGWALGALGLTHNDPDELAILSGQLKEIINELATIEAELAALENAIERLSCNALSSELTADRALIDTLMLQYQGFTEDGVGGDGLPPVAPPTARVDNWAAEVLSDTAGVQRSIQAMNNALLSAGTAQGIIAACLQPGVIGPPAVGSIGDLEYYNNVQALTNFWYLYQARGLLLIQEAYHWDAQQRTTATPVNTSDVCLEIDPTEPEQSAIVDDCRQSNLNTKAVYEHLAAQLLLAGAPYSDDKVVTHQRRSDDVTLWARSLEDFTTAAGDTCPDPLTSDAPCGITIGNVSQGRPIFQHGGGNFEYADYSIWRPAPNGALTPLISARGPKTAAGYLNAQGFKNADNKLVVTHDTFEGHLNFDDGSFHNSYGIGAVGCFLDMNLPFGVMCDDGQLQNYYDVTKHGCGRNVWVEFGPKGNEAGPNLYYDFRYATDTNPGGNCAPNAFTHSPGWQVAHSSAGKAQQYRWPMFDINNLTCSPGRSATNPGGAPTRCGTDYDAWFDLQVVRPQLCGGTEYGHCT